jgi:ferredoxin
MFLFSHKMYYISVRKENWEKWLEDMLQSYSIFTPLRNGFGLDYELLRPADIPHISYNTPKPATPLKVFFLPVRENVTSPSRTEKPKIIMGIPNCDIEALALLDEIYLDEAFNDIFYRQRRDDYILISSDCFSVQEHCHCNAYNFRPYSESKADLAVILKDNEIILRVITEKGNKLAGGIPSARPMSDEGTVSFIDGKHNVVEELLAEANKELPDYNATRELVNNPGTTIWERYSSKCVSCGACTAICPTCTCFLLIDKPGFDKVKQMDACQYPGFERVAGGEDVLFEIHRRFRNRYMCKYVWKPERFNSLACTGCGRCIEACIGNINKNELFIELEKQV